MIKFLLSNIFDFHEKLNAAKGILNRGAIESAVNLPFQTFDGKELYPTCFDKAVCLFFELTKNHGFADGNKRVASHALSVYLRMNHLYIDANNDEFYKISIGLASRELSLEDVRSWLLKKVTGMIFVYGDITIKNEETPCRAKSAPR